MKRSLALMGRPGRTIECTGEARALARTIVAVFETDGFTRRSAPDEFPVRLRAGSQALGVLASSHEIAFAVTAAVPGVRKRALPFEVTILHLGTSGGTQRLRIEASSAATPTRFISKRFTSLLDAALAELRGQGVLQEAGEYTDSIRSPET